MSIDLSRVNISLQQFQTISSGKYNAGEVTLADQVPGAGRARTSDEIYGEGGMRVDRADRRNEVNAALAGSGGTEEHEGIALAEFVRKLEPTSTFSAVLN